MDQLFSDWCMMPRKWSSFAKRKTEPLLCQSNTVTEFLCSGYPAYYDGKTKGPFPKELMNILGQIRIVWLIII